jgi:hypothetical protein
MSDIWCVDMSSRWDISAASTQAGKHFKFEGQEESRKVLARQGVEG